MKSKVVIASLIVASVTSGCENPKQAIGAVGGGALGAWAGSTIGGGRGKTVATAVGAVTGALAGGYIGSQLDKADRERAERTAQHTLETVPVGQSGQWKNPDSGNYGTVTPTRTYESQGRHCREYTQAITIGGRTQQGYGKACRQPDGSWQIMN